ncbi:MAG: mechanosensitive ion channel, partial [Alphaproteobacteria bacterium]|nr:mechanosensitive ion channel [Alphaproteobacteria bacterium]
FGGSARAQKPAAAALDAGATPQPADDLAAVLGTLPDDLTAAQIDAIVAVLDDGQARAALRSSLALLGVRAEASPPGSIMVRARDRLVEALATLPAVPALTRAAVGRDAEAGYSTDPFGIAARVGLVMAAGLLAAGLARRRLARLLELPSAGGDPASSPGRLARSGLVLLADSAGVAAFAAVVIGLYLAVAPANPRASILLEGLLAVLGVALLAAALSRFVLAPEAAGRRWMPVGDTTASAVHRALVRVLTVAALFAAPILYVRFLELPPAAELLAALAFSLAVTVTCAVLIWRHRLLIGAGLAAADRPVTARAFGTAAATIMIASLVVLWGLWSGAQLTASRSVAPQAGLSLLVVLLLPAAVRSLDRGLPTGATGDGAPLARGLRRTLRLVLVLAALWLILAIWGIDPAEGDGAGAALARIVFQGGVVLVLGYVGWLFLKSWLDRQIAAAQQAPAGSPASRMATLLPLMRAFALSVVATMVILSVLSSFGINIGPLLAGAGVVGLAIGFGAQSLVADIVAGIFFLLDDAFRIGEYVEVGTTRGTVEGITLRSLRLRHHRGAVHTLPFGQIGQLTNYSRDWVIMKLEFRVPQETDLARVKKLIKKIGADLAADETLGPAFLEPLKSQGVRRVEDDALIIGVKFMAKPGEQFTIRKEAYQRIVNAFRDNGIHLVAKGVTVKVDAADGIDPKVAAAAAEQVIQQPAANPVPQ